MCDVIADAVRTGDVARATEVLDRLEHVASAAADDLRRTVARLHPVVMEQQGLIQALGSLAETVQEEYGVDATFTRPSAAWQAENDRDTAIFQIAREAAINAARHGRPPVTISLERENGRILLAVGDAGGTLPTAAGNGIGLRMMRERATQIGAAITLDAARGGGRRCASRCPPRPARRRLEHRPDRAHGDRHHRRRGRCRDPAAGRHAALRAPGPAGGGRRLRRGHPRRRPRGRGGRAGRAGVRLPARSPCGHEAGAGGHRLAVLA